MQVLSKTNDDIIKEYFDAMQTEINPSVSYVNTNRNTLNKLSHFHRNKPFAEMKMEDIISYLNSHRKSDEIDPLHKWIGTYNSRISISHYSAPGGMRAGFEYYRAFPINVEQNKEHANVKLSMPVLALGGEYTSNAALTSIKSLAKDVRGGVIPLSGHWIAEERPDFLIEQLTKFFNE